MDDKNIDENNDLFASKDEYLKREVYRKVASLSDKDQAKLKFNNYEKIKNNFKTTFIIFNTKTGKIAEIKAASVVHAANLLGWRVRQVKLLDQFEGDQ